MTDTPPTHTQELLARASRHAAAARECAARHSATRAAVGPPSELERGHVAAALAATAAAVEDWIVWAHLATRVPLPREIDPTGRTRIVSTPRLWHNLPTIARARHRPAPATTTVLDPWLLLFLADLDTWYQSLHHHSPRADTELQHRLTALGIAAGDPDHRAMLVAPLAVTALRITGHVFASAHRITGLGVPRRDRTGLAGADPDTAEVGIGKPVATGLATPDTLGHRDTALTQPDEGDSAVLDTDRELDVA